jgi:low temperature requirement protein LtrA
MLTPSRLRDQTVEGRTSTPLELLFDLCFVVAVAALAAELHHGLVEGDTARSAASYLLLFVPVWWAWMSYTWFATAFSHDDPLTRVLTMLQMAGVLALSATVGSAIQGRLMPFAIAYAMMRVPLVLQWLRAAYDDPRHRGFALTYAAGSSLAQALWLGGALLHGPPRAVLFALALGLELSTPVLAVRRTPDRVFHPGHIAERYGLFTIIVLGETVLAVADGLRDARVGDAALASPVAVVASALVIVFGLWWIYFDALGRDGLTRNRRAAFTWGYGHFALFAAVAGIGAGIQVQLQASDHPELDPWVEVAAVSVPVAASLLAIAWLQHSANRQTGEAGWLSLAGTAALLVCGLGAALPPPGADLLLATIVSAAVLRGLRSATTSSPHQKPSLRS